MALVWLLLRRRHMARRHVAPGSTGAFGVGLLVPSAAGVLIGSIAQGAWGDNPVDLWQTARIYLPIMPPGLLVNIGLALLVADVIRLAVRVRPGPSPEEAP